MSSGFISESLVPPALFQLGIALALWAWARALTRSPGALPWRHTPLLPLIGLLLALGGIAFAALELDAAFDDIQQADASSKAQLLAEHISRAMNTTALLQLLTLTLYLATLVLCLAGVIARVHARRAAARPDPLRS